jgi:hypothetical protein
MNQQRGQYPGMGQGPNAAPAASQRIKEFFTYQEDFTGANQVVSGGSVTGNINIQADSDFVLQKLTYYADIAAAAQTANTRVIPNATIVITDTGSGRQLMESAVPIPSLFGTGQLPFILPTPRLFQARSTINLIVANFDAVEDYNIRVSFIGYKLYQL